MKIENLDHRICEDDYNIPSITLGCGGMNITGITHKEWGGVAFTPKIAGKIGDKNTESCGKTPEEIGAAFQIRATKVESLVVLRDHIDWAIRHFGEGVIDQSNDDVDK